MYQTETRDIGGVGAQPTGLHTQLKHMPQRSEPSSIKPSSDQARLTALYEFGVRLGQTLDLDQLLELVIDSILALTRAERGFIMLFSPQTGRLDIVTARNFDRSMPDETYAAISRSIVDRAITGGEAILTSDAQEDRRFSVEQSVIGNHLRSIMCAPLRARGRTIGALYVDNRFASSVFGQDDLDLLVTFANQAAIAIENARLFTQTDNALARRVEELSFFQQIDRQLNQSLDLERVLSLALGWAVNLTQADHGLLALAEAAGELWPHLAVTVRQGNTANLEETISARHPLLLQALQTGSSMRSRHPSAAGEPTSQLMVPVRGENRVIGVILLDSPHPRAFNRDDIAFMERLADRAAVAIENSRLYEAVRAAKQQQSDFIAQVTHELRAPLTTIMGYTDLMLHGIAGDFTGEQTELLQIVFKNSQQMNLLVQDLGDLNRIAMGRMTLKRTPFALADVLNEVKRDMRDRLHAKQQRLLIDVPLGLPPVLADRDRTGQIITNLVTNSHKYTPANGLIALRARHAGQFVAVDVIDNGIGIGPADRERLFTQFFRAETRAVREEQGWGLGLSIVKTLVEAQGGHITLSSEEGQGSLFTFTLPLYVGAAVST